MREKFFFLKTTFSSFSSPELPQKTKKPRKRSAKGKKKRADRRRNNKRRRREREGRKELTQTKHGRDQLVRLPKPFGLQRRRLDRDEAGPGLGRQRLGEHRLARPRRPVEQHAAGLPQQRRPEQRRLAQRRDDLVVQRLLDALEAADVAQALHVEVVVRDDLEGDDVLVGVGLDRPRGQAEAAGDLSLLVRRRLFRVGVGVDLPQGPLEEEGRAREGGRDEEELCFFVSLFFVAGRRALSGGGGRERRKVEVEIFSFLFFSRFSRRDCFFSSLVLERQKTPLKKRSLLPLRSPSSCFFYRVRVLAVVLQAGEGVFKSRSGQGEPERGGQMLARSATKQQSKKEQQSKRDREPSSSSSLSPSFLELAQLPARDFNRGSGEVSYLGQQILAATVLVRHGEEKKKKEKRTNKEESARVLRVCV